MVPTRSGYTFTGWYDNSDYTKGTKYYTDTNTPEKEYDKDITLYAGWSRDVVTQINISDSVITVASPQVYTGKKITPEVSVKYGSKTLTRNIDYTVSYYDNIDVGTAKVKVNGIGTYTGSKETTFKITEQEAKITCQNKTYNGSKQTIAECDGGTVSNATQTNAGSYIITCKGDNNHADAHNKTCTITSKALIAATAACGVITIIDWIVPDPIPVIDEAVLTGMTSLLGTVSGIVNSNIKKLVNEENAELTFEDVQTLTNEINSIKSSTTSMHK